MTKPVLQQLEVLCLTWENYAPAKSFTSLTLEQFKTRVQHLRDAVGMITGLNLELKGAIATRTTEEAEMNELRLKIIHAILGDAEFGEESDFYRANGYKIKSERRSGLTRLGEDDSGAEENPAAAI